MYVYVLYVCIGLQTGDGIGQGPAVRAPGWVIRVRSNLPGQVRGPGVDMAGTRGSSRTPISNTQSCIPQASRPVHATMLGCDSYCQRSMYSVVNGPCCSLCEVSMFSCDIDAMSWTICLLAGSRHPTGRPPSKELWRPLKSPAL